MQNQAKKRVLHRAKIINGQFKALINSIENDKYCVDIITQSLAIQNSLKSINAIVLENHLKEHAVHQLGKRGTDEKAVRELVKIYNLSNR